MSCFSEMNFGWCTYNAVNPAEPPSCPNYTFSIAAYQRKLDSHYKDGGRPPVLESFFLTRLPREYKDLLINMDCPTPLVMAHFIVSEMLLIAPPWENEFREEGWTHFDQAVQLAKGASPYQQHLMVAVPSAWPFRKAMDQVRRAQALYSEGAEAMEIRRRQSRWGAVPKLRRVDFVVAHCKENLDWIDKKLLKVPEGSTLVIYEKCGQLTEGKSLPGGEKFESVTVIPRPDKGRTRGDECSAYLTHIVSRYEDLADFSVFLQSDPQDHLHFDYLDLALRSIQGGTYSVSFLPLNGPRHVRTLTPCLQAVHLEILGYNLTEIIGPYCCAQFIVARPTIQARTKSFYEHMLELVDGTKNVDLCGVEGTKRSTQCYGYEFLWHVVFGEEVDHPNREDDARLPVALRLKHGREHVRLNWIGVPLARDIPLKVVPDYEHANPLAEE